MAAEELERAAKPGQILFDDATHRLVERVVSGEPMLVAGMDAYRLVEVLPTFTGVCSDSTRLSSAGAASWRRSRMHSRAVADRSLYLFSLLGPPGVGKSRLVREFVDGVEDVATVLQGRCLPYGRQSPTGRCTKRFAMPVSTRQLGDASATSVQSLFERLAVQRPLVVVLDDLHWAEAALLDGMEHVAESSRGAAILIIAVARPELLEARPGWGGGKPNASSALLESLSEIECDRLVDNLLGESDLPDSVRAYVIRTSDGNPLFVEELLATLVDRDLLTRSEGRWTTTEVPAIPLPSTIQALIAARIDRLPERERVVLELASIDGKKVFHRDMVVELAAEDVRADVDPCLAALVRKELGRSRPRVASPFATSSFATPHIRRCRCECVPSCTSVSPTSSSRAASRYRGRRARRLPP